MKFVQLILRKIIKIVATRRQILKLKCTKFDFDWGSAPDSAEGAYSAPPDPLAGDRRGGKRGEDERAGEEGEGRGRGGLSCNVAEEAFCLKSAPVHRPLYKFVVTGALSVRKSSIFSRFACAVGTN